MSNSAPSEISIEDLLCNSSLGSMVTLDYVTPLTEEANSENFVMGSDAAEFVDKVKDQVRNIQNVAESGEEHSIMW